MRGGARAAKWVGLRYLWLSAFEGSNPSSRIIIKFKNDKQDNNSKKA